MGNTKNNLLDTGALTPHAVQYTIYILQGCSKPRTKLKKNVIQSGLGGESRILSEGCDWLSAIPSYNLTANERPAGAQKRKDGGESSKQRVMKKMRGFGPNL